MARAEIADDNGGSRFASPAVKAALARSGAHVMALLAGFAGFALLLALVTHHAADPSGSTATSLPVRNLAGPLGATVSDLLLQGVGFAAYMPAVALMAWAWRLAMGRGISLFPARLAAVLLGMPVLAAGFSSISSSVEVPVQAGAGGALGPLVAAGITGWLQAILGPLGAVIGHGLLAILCVLVLLAALAFAPHEYRRAAAITGDAAATVARAGAARRHLVTRVLLGTGRAVLWLFGFGRRRKVEAGADLRGLLQAADAAADTHHAPRDHWREEPSAPATPAPFEAAEAPAPARPSVGPARKPAGKPVQPILPLEPGRSLVPPMELLREAPPRGDYNGDTAALQANARRLETVLSDFGVNGTIVDIRPGPVVTLYELEPAPGTKASRVIGLADDIARNMSVTAVRIATVPGRTVMGIEMPNAKRETVYFSEMLNSEEWTRTNARLPMALGKDIGGTPVLADLARMPHLLIAGTTGSGKSVGINTMILSLLYRFGPEECRFIMIDPKMLELSVYDRIPHLLAPVVTEPPKAIGALKWTVREMERRYRAMSSIGVRNIGGYNERVNAARGRGEVLTRKVQTGFDPETGKPVFEEQSLALEPLPMIVVVIDEMADLMIVAGKEIEAAVQRLAQMARAAGIHVIMATQRPSVDVITGTIKANFPSRISFMVTSKIDSRTILGEQGAEQLLGQGDLLFMEGGGRIKRVHGPFVSDEEVQRVADWLREQAEPNYVDEVTEAAEDDEGGFGGSGGINSASDGDKSLFDRAVDMVAREGKCSVSLVQRHLSIGYNKAAKLVEQMEKEGIVGPANHVGKREILVRRSDD
ncbi:DNA translocase FtsK [Rhodovarius crocodyli]|uniref:DNA translocase FtsK n=1 Tax=Rhodovarius crocodyli TaxID=1979269 RepID=A0A437MMA4_9PROT|nr:DNA translocase FtsK [Rhodovarius crocodyli]RVT98759.1 DNA translocase FtsK [Rhodovarius crocodyli]